MTTSRRDALKGLLALAASSAAPARHSAPRPANDAVPPAGIGRGIRHLSLQRSGRPARRRAGDVQPRPPLRRPHVQRRRHHPERGRPAAARAGRVLHRRHQHAHASSAGRRRPDAAGQRRQHRRDAVVRQPARLLRERARRQHLQQEEVPLGPQHPRHLASPARCARSPSSRSRASASTVCGGPAAATPIWRCTSTATPTTSLAIVDLQNITKPEIVSKLVAAGHAPRRRRAVHARARASAWRCIT